MYSLLEIEAIRGIALRAHQQGFAGAKIDIFYFFFKLIIDESMTYVRRRYVLTQCFQNVSHHVMLMKGIRTLSSTDKDSGIQYLYSGIHRMESRIQVRLRWPYMRRNIFTFLVPIKSGTCFICLWRCSWARCFLNAFEIPFIYNSELI